MPRPTARHVTPPRRRAACRACACADFGIFKKQLSQIVILAFVAMAAASLLAAVLLWGLFTAAGFPWPFMVCWLCGVINSATDPVAVVALLKELPNP